MRIEKFRQRVRRMFMSVGRPSVMRKTDTLNEIYNIFMSNYCLNGIKVTRSLDLSVKKVHLGVKTLTLNHHKP